MSIHICNLRVEDFRAFRGTHEFTFEADSDRHIELITGPNASGKSTFIEALQLCFYGESERDGFHSYVNHQIVDNLNVNERATARIVVTLVNMRTEETIRITREVSTIKTPQGRTDVIEEPYIEKQSEDGQWTKVDDPEQFLQNLIPPETHSFSFYDPERVIGLDTWEKGESFEALVDRMRELRNNAAHGIEMPESSAIDIGEEYLQTLNRYLNMVDDTVNVDRAEEYLVVDSKQNEAPVLSSGSQILISFALTLAAGELNGVEAPLVMDMPFSRVDNRIFETMCTLLEEVSSRQLIIVGFSDRVDTVAENLSESVGSYHRLAEEGNSSISIAREQ